MNRNKLYSHRFLLVCLSVVIIVGIVIGVRAIAVGVKRKTDIAQIEKKYPTAVITPSGIRYIVEQSGNGPTAIAGRTVRINYKGALLSGAVFDSSDVKGQPLEFELGAGQTIKGLDEAVIGMKEGEKRIVIIPPELGYGGKTMGKNAIPANSFLVFDVELYRIR